MSTVLIMAGGTGGHIMPGLAVAHELAARGHSIVWLGNPQGMEATLLAQQPYQFAGITFNGVRGKGLQTKLQLPWNLLRAAWQSWRVLSRVKPDAVLGMGGYISFPAGLMARLRGIPLVLHEQNAVAGLSNRVLARVAQRVLQAFPNTLAGATWVGNPVRADITRSATPAQRFAASIGNLQVLVVGGSLGAQALNSVVPQALALLEPAQRPRIVHQAGSKMMASLRTHYKQANLSFSETDDSAGIVLRAFIDDMAREYARADFVICRAGAMTVAEIACVGAAALFVPFPHAVDDHQTANAQFLSNSGAALLMQQNQLNAENLASLLTHLTRAQCLSMAEKARAQAKPEATVLVADVCEQLCVNKRYKAT